MPKTANIVWKIAAAAGLLLVAGCATPAPYAPRITASGTGYTDRQLSANRFRVSFRGNSVTPREIVEDDLLLRAAQVTLAAGSSHFLFDSRDTRADRHYDAIGAGPGWGGGWRFRPRWGYGGFGGGYGPDVDIITTTSFEAYAEIVLLNDAQASHEPRAIDARQVVAHLTPVPPPPPAPPV